MKKYLVHLILSKALTRKRLKALVIGGTLGFVFVFCALTVGGVMVAKELLPKAQASLSEIKPVETLGNIAATPITTEDCLNAISRSLSPKVWLTEPMAHTLKTIQTQCLGPRGEERRHT